MTADEAAIRRHSVLALLLLATPCRVPAGERLIDAQRRMLAALRLVGSRHPGECVAAVIHAVMIRLVVGG